MDLKLLGMLILIILISLFFMNEFKILKSHISETNENMTKLIKNKFHNLSSEITELNTDLVNQTRKINKIHSQKITSVSNYFTDSDNDGQNIINYLSDTKNNDELFKIIYDEDNNDNKDNKDNNNDDDIIINSSKLNDDVCDVCIIDNNNDNIHDNIHDNINLLGRLSSTKNNSSKDDDISINDGESIKSSKIFISNNSEKQSRHEQHEYKSVTSSGNKSNEIKIESAKLVLNNNFNNDTLSVESNKLKNMYDAISFGSKKSKGNKLNVNIEIGNNNIDDNNSIDSNYIKTFLDNNNIENYKKKNLDKLAHKLNISTFYKDGLKRILYKKEELYLKIKEELNKKSNH